MPFIMRLPEWNGAWNMTIWTKMMVNDVVMVVTDIDLNRSHSISTGSYAVMTMEGPSSGRRVMDLKSVLTNLPSGVEREFIIRDVGNSEEKFLVLLELALHEKDPLAWRATWVLDGCDELHPGLASNQISRITRRLPDLESKGSLRSLLRLLCRYDIPEEDQGILIDLCFGYLVSELYPLAVKVHAMQIIYNHVLLYPELKHELITVIEDQTENNSVGFMSRGRRIISQLEKM